MHQGGWGVRGFVLATGFHYESEQQICQHFNCHIFCGILDTMSITPRTNTLTAQCVVFHVFSGMRSLIAWSDAFSDRGGPNHLLFSVLPRLKSSESLRFSSKIVKFERIKSPTAFHSKGHYSSNQESYLTTLQQHQKAFCWWSLHSTEVFRLSK